MKFHHFTAISVQQELLGESSQEQKTEGAAGADRLPADESQAEPEQDPGETVKGWADQEQLGLFGPRRYGAESDDGWPAENITCTKEDKAKQDARWRAPQELRIYRRGERLLHQRARA